MRIVVLDAFITDQGDEGAWSELRKLGDTVVHARTSLEETAVRCAEAEIVLTNKVVMDGLAMGPKLHYIGILATGTNVVDLEAARSRGITVTNVPGYSTDSVAQLVFALLLHFTHDVAGHSTDVKAGGWATSRDFCYTKQPLMELHGKTLVILGTGAIGSVVERIGRAFGMEVLSARVPGSPRPDRMPLEDALPKADVVTLHCPLTDKTRNLVNEKFLAAMKPSAILINTGRGLLINESDLAAALLQGRLSGVGLDVLSREPPLRDHLLLDPHAPWARKVVVTPHLGWATIEARQRLVEMAVDNLKGFLAGKPLNQVL